MNRLAKHTPNSLRMARRLTAMLFMAMLLAACGSEGNVRERDVEPAKIKVMYWSEQAFNHTYGWLFSALHPHIGLEVADLNSYRYDADEDFDARFEAFIRDEKPDVLLLLNPDQFAKYAAGGRLVPLESYAARDRFDLDGLIPGMVDWLRAKGGGELFGLAPWFSSLAVYYNKDLFDRHGVEYPTDNMSWEELLGLAARFPTETAESGRLYGLVVPDLYGRDADLHELGKRIGTTMGLRLVNPADNRVAIDSESWIRAYELAFAALRSGTLYRNEGLDGVWSDGEYMLWEPFIGGRAAMEIGDAHMMGQIREAVLAAPDKAVNNWDIVTVPVDPANPGYSHDVTFGEIFAINAESANRDAAWAFIRYIHSDEYARVTSNSIYGEFPTRPNYIQDENGRNLAAFYALKPADSNLQTDLDRLPPNFVSEYIGSGMLEMEAVMDDRKSVRQALADLRVRLQAVLDAELRMADGTGGPG